MNIHDIVRDSKGFPDDLTVPITNPETGEVTNIPLADVRSKFRSADADYTRKAQELAEARRQFEEQKLEWAYRQTAPPADPVQNVAREPVADDLEAFFEPVYKKIESKYDPFLKHIEDLQNEIKRRDAETLQAYTTYAAMEIEKRYAALPEKPTTEDGRPMNAKDFARYAVERGYRDAYGFPDLERASSDYFGPKRLEQKIREAKELGKKEAMEEVQRQAFMGRPGLKRDISPDSGASQRRAATPDVHGDAVPGVNRTPREPQGSKRSRGIFVDALNQAINDPDVREGLYSLKNRG